MEELKESTAYPHWQKIGFRHHHGINIPLFSLHSRTSCGIGEFPDLLPIIDWCTTINFDIIQLLPLNDTGLDPSPYNSLSAYALNPIHLGLSSLPRLDLYPDLQDKLRLMSSLTDSQKIDYTLVRNSKEDFLRLYYKKEGKHILSSAEYQAFLRQVPWLQGYALFKALKSRYDWTSWQHWPEEIQNPTEEILNRLYKELPEEISWNCFIQYLCYLQLHQVKLYAESKHIFVMGDIPILISPDSADVWLNRSIFDLEHVAGAPPDYYNVEGQKWGFPLYNWEALAKKNYIWWEQRLSYAGYFYHLYRIDHVIGFFRIWAISPQSKAKEGYFIPQNRSEWLAHGEKLLHMMLERSPMLPIGEDLGDVPPEVRPCLKRLGICSTKVMRWERRWMEDRRFIKPEDYELISLTTVSTHDSETLSLWWHQQAEEAKEFANLMGWWYSENLGREHLREILWDSHHTNSLLHVNLLQEYLAFVPGLTWPSLQDERINIPGVISENNWCYRYKPSSEEITNNTTLSHLMRELSQ